MDRTKYPTDWDAIADGIRARARGRCECHGECGNLHETEPGTGDDTPWSDEPAAELFTRCASLAGRDNPVTRRTVILTVAHLNHTPMDCRDENLRAMCQRCHLSYDRERHIAKQRANRRAARAAGDLFDGL